MTDPRPFVFRGVADRTVTASVTADDPGIVVATETAAATAAELGLAVDQVLPSGKPVQAGDEILRVTGTPLQIALCEERVIGVLAKPSGIASAARAFVERAAGGPRIVSGAWKKLPYSQKEMIRSAIVEGGAQPRIAEWPFAYLDKNFVRMLGGVRTTLAAVTTHPELAGYRRIIQVTNAIEACEAAAYGADTVFVDTGSRADVVAAAEALRRARLRDRVELAFGGGITLDDIDALRGLDLDIVDVGRAIVDAGLLDMSMRVVEVR